ncbi:MAG: hypothetical protein WAM68_05425 [Acidobacteriaceae bacterium]
MDFRGLGMQLAGAKRKIAALAFLAILAALAWYTLDPGRIRLVVMILLGGFALRIALATRVAQDEGEAQSSR